MEDIKLVKVKEPDPERLAKIVKAIKGYGNANDLADYLQVNPSTVSRILNGKITGPVQESTILKLAEMIRPEMGITKEMLFDANGMRNVNQMTIGSRMEARRVLEHQIEDIIINGIYNHSASCWRYSDRQRVSYRDKTWVYPTLTVETGAVVDEDKPENRNWAFHIVLDMLYRHQGYDGPSEDRYAMSRIAQNINMWIGEYTLLSLQYDRDLYMDDYEYHQIPAKVSYVVTSPSIYELLKERYMDLKVPVQMSIILVDLEKRTVVSEMPFRNMNGYRDRIFFDDKPAYFDDEDNEISEEDFIKMIEEEVIRLEKEDN